MGMIQCNKCGVMQDVEDAYVLEHGLQLCDECFHGQVHDSQGMIDTRERDDTKTEYGCLGTLFTVSFLILALVWFGWKFAIVGVLLALSVWCQIVSKYG